MPFNQDNFNEAIRLLGEQGTSEDEIFAELDGASDSDIDDFSGAILKDLQQQEGVERTGGALQTAEAIARGAGNTLTFGQLDRVAALADAGLGELLERVGVIDEQSFSQRLDDAQADQELIENKLRRENSLATGLGDVLGFFLPVGAGALAVKTGRSAAKAVRAGRTASAGRGVAAIAAEGAASAATFAGGREAIEVATGEQSVAGAAQNVGLETALSTVGGVALTGGGSILSTLKQTGQAFVAPAVRRIAQRAKNNLPDNLAEILDGLPKAGNLLDRASRQENTAALNEVAETLSQTKATLQQQVSEATEQLAPSTTQLKATLDQSIEDTVALVANGLEQQKLPAEQLDDALNSVSFLFNQSRRSLNRAYGSNLDGIVAAHTKAGTKINLDGAVDDILLNLENAGLIAEGRPVSEAIASSFKPGERSAIESTIETLVTSRKEVSFTEANEIKKLVGSIADFSNVSDPAVQSYGKIRGLITEADEGVTGLFDELSKGYTEGRRLTDSLKRQTRDVDDTAKLLRNIARDVKNPQKGTPLVGKANKLLELKNFEVFSPDEQQVIKGTFQAVRRNLEIERLQNPATLRSRFKKLSGKVNSELNDADIEEIRSFVGNIEEINEIQRLGENLQLPAAVRSAIKNPTDKNALENARALVKKTAPQSLGEFNKTLARAAKLERLKGLPANKNKVLSMLRERQLPEELLQEAELASNFIPELDNLIDDVKLGELLQDKQIVEEIRRTRINLTQIGLGAAGVGAVSGEELPIIGELGPLAKAALGVAALLKLAQNPTGLALVLERSRTVTNKKAAERLARSVAPKARFIRQAVTALTPQAAQQIGTSER